MCGIMLPAVDVTVLNVECVCVCVWVIVFNAQLQYSATYMLEIFISVERRTHTSPYMTWNAFFPSSSSFKHDQEGGFMLVVYCYFFPLTNRTWAAHHSSDSIKENVPQHWFRYRALSGDLDEWSDSVTTILIMQLLLAHYFSPSLSSHAWIRFRSGLGESGSRERKATLGESLCREEEMEKK